MYTHYTFVFVTIIRYLLGAANSGLYIRLREINILNMYDINCNR